MDRILASDYLLLIVGTAILLAVLVGVVLPNVLPTPRGQLNRQRRELRHRLYELNKAEKASRLSLSNYEAMRAKAQTTSPHRLARAEQRAKDMETLLGHARDRVLVAENHLRRTIIDRYPPVHHGRMLNRFVPDRKARPLPFGF